MVPLLHILAAPNHIVETLIDPCKCCGLLSHRGCKRTLQGAQSRDLKAQPNRKWWKKQSGTQIKERWQLCRPSFSRDFVTKHRLTRSSKWWDPLRDQGGGKREDGELWHPRSPAPIVFSSFLYPHFQANAVCVLYWCAHLSTTQIMILKKKKSQISNALRYVSIFRISSLTSTSLCWKNWRKRDDSNLWLMWAWTRDASPSS